MGSGPSIWLASNEENQKNPHQFRGLILQSAFTSGIRCKLNIAGLPFDMFPNIDRIEKVTCPVFLIHGKEDKVVPFDHSQVLIFK